MAGKLFWRLDVCDNAYSTIEYLLTLENQRTNTITNSMAISPTHDAPSTPIDHIHEKLQHAVHLYQNDKILSAARLLQSIPSIHYEAIHYHIQKEGKIFQRLLDQSNDHHGTSPRQGKGDGWIKQGEQHGRYNFCIYYKLSQENHLTCRIETPIGADLLVPLLSVLVSYLHV